MPPSPAAPARAEADAFGDLPPRIVFYDGLCVFCNRSARWILAHDPAGRFHFASLAGDTAARLRAGLPGALPSEVDSVVLAELGPGRAVFQQRSAALRRILQDLDGFLPGLLRGLLAALPAAWADAAYDAFARRRSRLFGQFESCPLPPAGPTASRFLP